MEHFRMKDLEFGMSKTVDVSEIIVSTSSVLIELF